MEQLNASLGFVSEVCAADSAGLRRRREHPHYLWTFCTLNDATTSNMSFRTYLWTIGHPMEDFYMMMCTDFMKWSLCIK